MRTARYYSDAEDMLFDIAATDFADRDVINDVEKQTIISMAQIFGRSATEIARALMRDRVQVEQVLQEVYSFSLRPM
jgi:hypothetical protein